MTLGIDSSLFGDDAEKFFLDDPFLYLNFHDGNGEVGIGFGGGGLALTRTLAADMSDIAKIYFTDIYYAAKTWRMSYQMTMDPILTGFDSDFSGGDVSLASTSTLSIGFKF